MTQLSLLYIFRLVRRLSRVFDATTKVQFENLKMLPKSLAVAASAAWLSAHVKAANDGIAVKPPMGWRRWVLSSFIASRRRS